MIYRRRQRKKKITVPRETKSKQITVSDVRSTADDKADDLLFRSASALAKDHRNTRVDDYVHLSSSFSTTKGEKQGITITLEDGSVIKYLKVVEKK